MMAMFNGDGIMMQKNSYLYEMEMPTAIALEMACYLIFPRSSSLWMFKLVMLMMTIVATTIEIHAYWS